MNTIPSPSIGGFGALAVDAHPAASRVATVDMAPTLSKLYTATSYALRMSGELAAEAGRKAIELVMLFWRALQNLCARILKLGKSKGNMPEDLTPEQAKGDASTPVTVESDAGGPSAAALANAISKESEVLVDELIQRGPDLAKLADPEHGHEYLQKFVSDLLLYEEHYKRSAHLAREEAARLAGHAAAQLGTKPAAVSHQLSSGGGGGVAGLIDPQGKVSDLSKMASSYDAGAVRVRNAALSILEGVIAHEGSSQLAKEFAATRLSEIKGLPVPAGAGEDFSVEKNSSLVHNAKTSSGASLPVFSGLTPEKVTAAEESSFLPQKPSPFASLAQSSAELYGEDDVDPRSDRPQQ